MSKVDLFAAIRRDSRAGLSVRALARKYQVSRRTVRSALTSAWPAPRKPMPPRPSKLDAVKPVTDDILRADLGRTPQAAAHRQPDPRPADAEHDMHDVSYAVVRAYVADRKPKIRVEAGRGPVNVFFLQTHRPSRNRSRRPDAREPGPAGWAFGLLLVQPFAALPHCTRRWAERMNIRRPVR